MKVVHFAPFAPFRCGLYEAARDWCYSDSLRGHEVLFVERGIPHTAGGREPAKVGAVDPRGGWPLVTVEPSRALDADLWVCHDGLDDNLAARCQVPMLWVLHGRPLATFRQEQSGRPGNAYSIMAELATWPRVKAMVTMWPEFEPHLRLVCRDKLRVVSRPPLDASRFRREGERRPWDPQKTGERNVLICDSWREDVDVYEVAVASWWAALHGGDTRFKAHFWGVGGVGLSQQPWQHVWAALDRAGALGEIHANEAGIERVYRAADVLASPHRIAVRTIMEATSCGLPIVAAAGCPYTAFTADPADTVAYGQALLACLRADRAVLAAQLRRTAHEFSLEAFGAAIEPIYREAAGLSASRLAAEELEPCLSPATS